MNESRFDTIARCLARAQSRRRLLGGLSGSVVAVAGVIALPFIYGRNLVLLRRTREAEEADAGPEIIAPPVQDKLKPA